VQQREGDLPRVAEPPLDVQHLVVQLVGFVPPAHAGIHVG
jgi:hypothetical protein